MTDNQNEEYARRASRTSILVSSLCLASTLSCGSGGGSVGVQEFPIEGDFGVKPDGTPFVVQADHRSGDAQEVRLSGAHFGRLVDVFGLDAEGDRVPMYTDFVIGPMLTSNAAEYELGINPVTQRELLTILRQVDTVQEREEFDRLLLAAEQNLMPVFDYGVDSNVVLSTVPRNAVIVLTFDDLLAEDTVGPETIRVTHGVPPIVPFDARIFADSTHGGLADTNRDDLPEFYSTRIIIDPTISELESFQLSVPAAVNALGFPASVTTATPNLAIRMPSLEDSSLGQNRILRNLSGHALAATSNGSVDYEASTRDVLRELRAGGGTEVTGDPNNGFLPDDLAPELVSNSPIHLLAQPLLNTSDGRHASFVLPEVAFVAGSCALSAWPGDVIRQGPVFAEVVERSSAPLNGSVVDVVVRVLSYPPVWDALHPQDVSGRVQGFRQWTEVGLDRASFHSVFRSDSGLDLPECFVEISPAPASYPTHLTRGLSPKSRVTLAFSEPMDPTSLTAFDSMTLTRRWPVEASTDYVIGGIEKTADLRRFTFVPSLDLAHTLGLTEPYTLRLASDARAPTDLAGNPLASTLPPIQFQIDASSATRRTGGRVSRFSATDEDAPFGEDGTSLPEWTGQHLFDLQRELIQPRPVIRYSALADRSQVVPGAMVPFAPGVQTPLSSLGSKMQTIWRGVDVGFGLQDTGTHNVDIEGLSWAPVGGQVAADHFSDFEIRLSHSKHLPDEVLDTFLLPQFPQSGLKKTFANNPLDLGVEPQAVVHPGNLGYSVSPGDVYTASSGTRMIPFPLNRTIPQSEWRTFTWRDTRLLTRAGSRGGGAEVWSFFTLLGLPVPEAIFPVDEVPSIGLPLLMEFRCSPDDEALGLNAFDVSIASNSSARPYFRAFSTGGLNQSGLEDRVEPDLEYEANGGFNPNPQNPGLETPGVDPTFYLGAMDLVIRVSTSYSVWFDVSVGAQPLQGGVFEAALLEPKASEQPLGTSVEIAFRSARAFTDLSSASRADARSLDPYGDHYLTPAGRSALASNPDVVFTDGDASWKTSSEGLAGAEYYQLRVTFLSNPMTGLSPTLSALALAWSEGP